MVVKTRETIGRGTFEQLAEQAETLAAADRAAEEARAIPARVERWFGESNFHHAEFADLRRLANLKETQGVTVSLVLPTLNEEETVGPIVRRAIREMMGRVPLLDEILVIDSASTDRTREIAEAEGARVVEHPRVLTRYGSFIGKGEALWKSLYETTGDIIVWADTDVRNWHPRMVYGTLGPLLAEPRLQYVKGYYQRPIVEAGVLKEGGGGRVTELVARPLINLFYPELSGFIQPLAGEYAGRRTLLETIPFFTGYAVEMGHLIDIAERVGIEGLGQVDLERRVHRNQELEGLSRMSFVILQAVMKRLEERRKARLFAELGSTMKLPRSGRGRLGLEVIELADHERPPMIRIPEYAERRGLMAGGGRRSLRSLMAEAGSIRIAALVGGRLRGGHRGAGRAARRRGRRRRGGQLPRRGRRGRRPPGGGAAGSAAVADGTISPFVAFDGERGRRIRPPHPVAQPELAPPGRDRQGDHPPLGPPARARDRPDGGGRGDGPGRGSLAARPRYGDRERRPRRSTGRRAGTRPARSPNYAMPTDGTPAPATWYWKDLR